MSITVEGTTEVGFDCVREAFTASFDGKPTMGAALSVLHRGRPAVDLWGGLSDTDRPWQADTPSVIFSCTKGLMALLAARLVQEGRLDYLERVTMYWPEFGAAGKQDVRVKDLLAHRSGLSAPRDLLTVDDALDWDGIVARLAAQEPLWTPDTGYAYHALTHGWLIGEVIRRITGASVGQYFAEVVTGPLQLDAWIGLPKELNERVARMQVGPTLSQLVAEQAAARPAGEIDWSDRAMTLGRAFEPELVGPDSGFNDPRVRSAEIPGAGGIATARALATIWSATFTETAGVRLLNSAVLRRATEVQSEGMPVWDVPGPWPRWGMGFQLDSEARRYVTNEGYGHDGAGGQVAFADPGAGIGFAFLTNQMEAIEDHRATRIVDAVRKALAPT